MVQGWRDKPNAGASNLQYTDQQAGGLMLHRNRFILPVAALLLAASTCFADDSARLLRVDHYVRVHSAVPSISGQTSQIYVREVVQAGIALRGPSSDRVALFVHAAGRPAGFSFDVPYQ